MRKLFSLILFLLLASPVFGQALPLPVFPTTYHQLPTTNVNIQGGVEYGYSSMSSFGSNSWDSGFGFSSTDLFGTGLGRMAGPGRAIGILGARMFNEPLDWAMTFNSWGKGDFRWTDVIGLLPIASAGAGRAFNDAMRAMKSEARGVDDLSDTVKATFREGKYRAITLKSDVTAYRYSDGVGAQKFGRYLTTRQTVSMIDTPADAKSMLKLYNNEAIDCNRFIIPKGTTIYVGRVEGGGSRATQIFIEDVSVLRELN